jgi:hypothetical protein
VSLRFAIEAQCRFQFHRDLETLHLTTKCSLQLQFFGNTATGLQIEGVLAYFMHLICQKRIGDDVGVVRYVFTPPKNVLFCDNIPPDMLYPPNNART